MIRKPVSRFFIRAVRSNLVYDGTQIGYMGEVHPTVAHAYGIGERAYVAVLDMPSVVEKRL